MAIEAVVAPLAGRTGVPIDEFKEVQDREGGRHDAVVKRPFQIGNLSCEREAKGAQVAATDSVAVFAYQGEILAEPGIGNATFNERHNPAPYGRGDLIAYPTMRSLDAIAVVVNGHSRRLEQRDFGRPGDGSALSSLTEQPSF